MVYSHILAFCVIVPVVEVMTAAVIGTSRIFAAIGKFL
jgi:hypothetical protein